MSVDVDTNVTNKYESEHEGFGSIESNFHSFSQCKDLEPRSALSLCCCQICFVVRRFVSTLELSNAIDIRILRESEIHLHISYAPRRSQTKKLCKDLKPRSALSLC